MTYRFDPGLHYQSLREEELDVTVGRIEERLQNARDAGGVEGTPEGITSLFEDLARAVSEAFQDGGGVDERLRLILGTSEQANLAEAFNALEELRAFVAQERRCARASALSLERLRTLSQAIEKVRSGWDEATRVLRRTLSPETAEETDHLEELWKNLKIDIDGLANGTTVRYALRASHLRTLESQNPRQAAVEREVGFPAWLEDPQAPCALFGLPSPQKMIELLVWADKDAKREGLLALEDHMDIGLDPYADTLFRSRVEYATDDPRFPLLMSRLLHPVVEGLSPGSIRDQISLRFDRFRADLENARRIAQSALRSVFTSMNPRALEEGLRKDGLALFPYAGHRSFEAREHADAREVIRILVQAADEHLRGTLISRFRYHAAGTSARGSTTNGAAVGRSHEVLERGIVRILQECPDDLDGARHAVELLFSRLREELDVVEALLGAGVLMIQAGEEPAEIEAHLHGLLPGAEAAQHSSAAAGPAVGFASFTQALADRVAYPQPVYRGLEDLIGRLAEFSRETRRIEADSDDPEIQRVVAEVREAMSSPAGNTPRDGFGRTPLEALYRERCRGYTAFLEADQAAFEAAQTGVREALETAEVDHARRHPSFENVHLLLDRSGQEELAIQALRSLIERHTRVQEAKQSEAARSRRRILEAASEVLGRELSSDEAPAAHGDSFEVRLARNLYSDGPAGLSRIVEEHFRNDSEREYLRRHIFRFDDLFRLSSTHLQKVIREVDLEMLAHALAESPSERLEEVVNNMSPWAASRMRDYLGNPEPVSPSERSRARDEVVRALARLELSGEIIVPGRHD